MLTHDHFPALNDCHGSHTVLSLLCIRISLDESTGTLMFATTLSQDTGMYTCRIHNDVGAVEAVAMVTVLVPPEITEAPKYEICTFSSALNIN